MSQELPKKEPKGWMIAGIFIGLIIILTLILFTIIFILSLLAAPTLLNAANKAKAGAIKANVSAAASVSTTYLTVDQLPAQEAAKKTIYYLNTANTPDEDADDAYSPFDPSLPAFDSKPGPGVVVIKAKDANTIVITGYDKQEKPIAVKAISPFEYKQASEKLKNEINQES